MGRIEKSRIILSNLDWAKTMDFNGLDALKFAFKDGNEIIITFKDFRTMKDVIDHIRAKVNMEAGRRGFNVGP